MKAALEEAFKAGQEAAKKSKKSAVQRVKTEL